MVGEEVSSLAAEVLPPPRPSSAGLFETVTKLSFSKENGAPPRWIDHVRTILGLVYCMVHLASSPVAYSVPSQGVPQI
jgi:hypothetical protein